LLRVIFNYAVLHFRKSLYFGGGVLPRYIVGFLLLI